MAKLDVAIVGGGPAGLATALFLAHAAPARTERIVVLEKERYPRDKPCAGAIGARADRALATIGVAVDAPSVRIDGVAVATLEGDVVARDREIARVVRRVEWDHALARVARSRGIRVDEGVRVEAVHRGGGSTTLATCRGEIEASIVVGADGVGSVVRRALGLGAGLWRAQAIEVDTEEVAGDRERDLLAFDFRDRGFDGYSWDFPTLVEGRPMVCRGVYQLRREGTNAPDVATLLARDLARRGLALGDFRPKRFAERGWDRRERRSAPGVVLVGEAAGIDAMTGEGIAQAVLHGRFAGAYLAEKLDARDLTLDDYDARVARSSVGVDLGVRERLVPLHFGPRRAAVEHFAASEPELLRLGMLHLAGRHVPRARLAAMVARGGAALALDALRRRVG